MIPKGRLIPLLLSLLPMGAAANELVTIGKAELGREFLMQTSYERDGGWQDLMTSRSRITVFRRRGSTLEMLERHNTDAQATLATFPILGETNGTLNVDFNAGFNRVLEQEDRTGEDYYGRFDNDDRRFIPLTSRKMLSVNREGSTLVLDQQGLDEDGRPIIVHYYLTPYRHNVDFMPFELQNLRHFGFYETYPRRHSGRIVLYATKFDVHKPIVLALSAEIPAQYRPAVRDGVRYWNRALGMPLLRVIDAPEGVRAPSPEYNVIQWEAAGDQASTSHIQSDPLTGEILHASIFLHAQAIDDDDFEDRADHLRYVVAHEVGHALGLRHNFSKGPVSTVMNYFSFEETVRIGHDVIAADGPALEYDRKVIRHVYLEEPIDIDALPPFCTDNQAGCSPFPALSALHPAER